MAADWDFHIRCGMQIVCPNCATSYEVSEASIGAGRPVRCVRCREVWVATPQPAMAETAAAPDTAGFATRPEPGPDLEDAAAWGMDALPEPEPPAPALTAPPEPREPTEPVASPALVPADDPPPSLDELDAGNGATLAAPPAKPRAGPLRPTWPAIILCLAAVIATILAWRAEVARALPQTASLFAAIGLPVNLRGLVFAEVRTATEMQDGVPVLVVEGAIANVTRTHAEVPRLRLAMRDAAGLEVYAWTARPPRPTLAPGEAQPFRTRLASPPPEGREVLVRFLTARDR